MGGSVGEDFEQLAQRYLVNKVDLLKRWSWKEHCLVILGKTTLHIHYSGDRACQVDATILLG